MQLRLNRATAVIVSGLFASSVMCGCSKKEQTQIKVLEQITFCQGGNTPVQVFVAAANGDFAKEGLEGVVRRLGDGKSAMNAFLAGDCTFVAGVGEPPIVTQSYARSDFVVLGSLERSDNFARVLARKDKGISKPGDLRGKKLGVKKGVASHIFADYFLKKHGLTYADLDVRYMEQKDMPNALALGDIDAAACSDATFLEGKEKLRANGVVLEEPGLLTVNSYLVARKDFAGQKPETVKKMVRALLNAEKLITANPADAAAKLASAANITTEEATAIITKRKHALVLTSELINSLKLNSDWMMANGMLEKKQVHDFRGLIDERFLKELNPSAVSL